VHEQGDGSLWTVITYSPQAVAQNILGIDLILPNSRVELPYENWQEESFFLVDSTDSASSLIFTVCDIVYEEKIAGTKSPPKTRKTNKKLSVSHQTSHSVADPLVFVPIEMSHQEVEEPESDDDLEEELLVERRISVSTFKRELSSTLSTVLLDDDNDILPNPDRFLPIDYDDLYSTIETNLHARKLPRCSVDLIFEFLQLVPWSQPKRVKIKTPHYNLVPSFVIFSPDGSAKYVCNEDFDLFKEKGTGKWNLKKMDDSWIFQVDIILERSDNLQSQDDPKSPSLHMSFSIGEVLHPRL